MVTLIFNHQWVLTCVRMRAFLCCRLRNTFEPLGVRRYVFQLGDAEFEDHVANVWIRPAHGGQDKGQRFSGVLAAST